MRMFTGEHMEEDFEPTPIVSYFYMRDGSVQVVDHRILPKDRSLVCTMPDFREIPRISRTALTLVALGAVFACMAAGYVAVSLWNHTYTDENRISGFERAR